MAIIDYVNSLFPPVPKDDSVKQRQESIRRGLSSVYSRGNVSLQLNRYLTSDDIAKRKKKLSTLTF